MLQSSKQGDDFSAVRAQLAAEVIACVDIEYSLKQNLLGAPSDPEPNSAPSVCICIPSV